MKYLSQLLLEERTKEASTVLPLIFLEKHRHPRDKLEAAGIAAIRSVPTDIGMNIGMGLGALAGNAMLDPEKTFGHPGWVGGGLGALLGGAAGYATSGPLLRMVLGDKEYNKLFEKD